MAGALNEGKRRTWPHLPPPLLDEIDQSVGRLDSLFFTADCVCTQKNSNRYG
jgi:hypothetical protein